MIYRTYGQTGKEISALGFGGMRFNESDPNEKNAELILHAHEQGINYVDTAPYYCGDTSEDIVGLAFRQMKTGSCYVSTKSEEPDGKVVREFMERSLERLGVDRIDFYNIWCIRTPEDWEARKKRGAVDAVLQAQQDGLVEHVVCSTHLMTEEACNMLNEKTFDGVTIGYNAVNFPFRDQVVREAGKLGMGVVCMNPLNGGLIPQHAERFDFIRSPEDPDVVQAALRFVLSNPDVTSALVGFNSKAEIDQAVKVVEAFEPLSDERQSVIKTHITDSFEGLCTGCEYCLPCPVNIPIPQMMDAYNMRILNGEDNTHITERLKWHWSKHASIAGDCTQCGQCEDACTQHLPIMERLAEIAPLEMELLNH